MLSNGMGGIDWAGLPLACAFFGVREIEPLIERLQTMKQHKPAKD